MRTISTLMTVLVAGMFFAPGQVQAQGGPPSAVADRIPAEAAAGQEARERGAEGRERGQQARERGQLNRGGAQRGQSVGRCATGLDIALGTPAGPVLERVFGRGGPAEHARACGEGAGQAREGVLDRLPTGGRDAAGARRGGPPADRGNPGRGRG